MVAYAQIRHVLIASPSDVADREDIFKTIATWNGLAGNTRRAVIFVPLMWDINAISDADSSPQAAINEQLLNRADYILAVFYGRLGTPTEDFPAGTVEELMRRKGKAAVFFHQRPAGDIDDPARSSVSSFKSSNWPLRAFHY